MRCNMTIFKNELDTIYTTINKNLDFIIKEYQAWHLETYYKKASIEDFEKCLGLTKQSIYHSINNARKASSEKLLSISLYFDINIDTLCKVDLEKYKEWPEMSKKMFERIGSINGGGKVE